MAKIWSLQEEEKVLNMRNLKKTYSEIAFELNLTESSVKHKFRRLTQNNNDERYHHPIEKIKQINRILPKQDFVTLETNCGWGNLTKEYQKIGSVLSIDIDKQRTAAVNEMQMQDVDTICGDSFIEIYRLIGNKCKFNVIDLDPYGLPSRFFPHIYQLIDDGWMFVTVPKFGVQKINKITLKHLELFWGINQENKSYYREIITNKIIEYGMFHYRKVELIEDLELKRVYRMAFRVKRESALDLVGLKVNR